MSAKLIYGHSPSVLRSLPAESIDCCVTSPPYWGLRDYRVEGQIGLEATPAEYVERIVEVMCEVHRTLKTDGTLWLNLGDTYCNSDKWGGGGVNTGKHTKAPDGSIPSWIAVRRRWADIPGIKPKDLIGVPWRVALALQAVGWYLRADIIWSKLNPMPESVTDRPTKAHEYVFLLSRSEKYYYDADAIREPFATDPKENYPERAMITGRGDQEYAQTRGNDRGKSGGFPPASHKGSAMNKGKTAIHQLGRSSDAEREDNPLGRNKRSVWNISARPFPEAHFAVMPEELVTPCVLAGCPEGGTVLDPFAGSGTVGVVALKHGRKFIGIDLNRNYVEMARRRLNQVNPLFNPECGVAEEYARDKGEEENV